MTGFSCDVSEIREPDRFAIVGRDTDRFRGNPEPTGQARRLFAETVARPTAPVPWPVAAASPIAAGGLQLSAARSLSSQDDSGRIAVDPMSTRQTGTRTNAAMKSACPMRHETGKRTSGDGGS
jgi:hypothetical protein